MIALKTASVMGLGLHVRDAGARDFAYQPLAGNCVFLDCLRNFHTPTMITIKNTRYMACLNVKPVYGKDRSTAVRWSLSNSAGIHVCSTSSHWSSSSQRRSL